MFHEKQLFNRIRNQGVGPGGWTCRCCSPPPSFRKAWIRKAKRGKFKTMMEKMVEDELIDDIENRTTKP